MSTFGTQVENDFQKREKKKKIRSMNLFIETLNTPHALDMQSINISSFHYYYY